MRQRHLNLIFGIGFIIMLCVSLWPDESNTQNQQIDYEIYKRLNQEINDKFAVRDSQDLAQDTIIQSMKLTIVTDEKTIRNATNNDVDSIFNAMVARQRKSSLQ